jgi:hypothetical protein
MALHHSSPLVPLSQPPKRAFPIEFTVFRYKTDETLIFYHHDAQRVVDAILPYHEAQALHLLPYASDAPRDKPVEDVQREQVFNAAWNGLILGYPRHFIEHYCTDYHNDLSPEGKKEEFHLAITHFQKYLQSNAIDRSKQEHIGYGYHSPIDRRFIRDIDELLQSYL